jgi:DNA-binding MarR family transcriptional regulator
MSSGRYRHQMARSGADLALLLLGGFRRLVDSAHEELSRRGYEDVRTAHDFAIRAIAAGAYSASELSRRMSVTKQAAAQTITVLQDRGYVVREADPADARRKRLRVTERGFALLREGESIFDDLREQWARRIGDERLLQLEAQLRELVGPAVVRLDAPGWVAAQGLGASTEVMPRSAPMIPAKAVGDDVEEVAGPVLAVVRVQAGGESDEQDDVPGVDVGSEGPGRPARFEQDCHRVADGSKAVGGEVEGEGVLDGREDAAFDDGVVGDAPEPESQRRLGCVLGE